ncbi:hypothetical protein DRO60_04925 [Candidatus Bathyarchaeota archaeon]|nr:MAG: hypothetical protein DRO60_04925 [Candidatus Bathyarchaeota archaeon]
MRKLGMAVIGVGFWGRNHARVLNSLERAELIAVCDLDRRRAEEVAATYGAEAYTDSSELLRRDDVEAVTICTWSTVLAREAERALRAGKHVLVEKPMAKTLEEARELVELAGREDLALAVGFVERFNPGFQRVRELISSGRLGELLTVVAQRLSRWPKRPWDVGVVKDLAIHDLDLTVNLMGELPRAVYAHVSRVRRRDLDDRATIMLEFSGGPVGIVEANWLTPYKVRALRVIGSEGILNLDYLSQRVVLEGQSGRAELAGEWREPLRLELEHFVSCVLEGREPMVSGRDGLIALSLCEAALRSSSERRPVDVAGFLRRAGIQL